jgi:peptidoglycan/LPS O-acetylase OafA/YrhL
VYPIYLVGLLLAIVPTFSWTGCSSIKLACGMGDRPLTVVSSLTLLQSWTSGLPIRWNQPSWSLSVEATFYLLFPLIVIPLMRLATRRCVAVIAGLWLLGAACVFVYLDVIPRDLTAGSQGWLQFMMFNPLMHLPGFLIGIVLCRAFVLYGERGVPGRRIAGARNDLVVVAVVVLTLVVLVSGLVPDLYLHNGFLDPLFALGIYALATGEGRAAALLSTPALILLGEASYGMYIFHVPIADWLIHGIRQGGITALNPDEHLASFLVIYLALLIAFSIASFVLLEQPARRAIRRAFAGRRNR